MPLPCVDKKINWNSNGTRNEDNLLYSRAKEDAQVSPLIPKT